MSIKQLDSFGENKAVLFLASILSFRMLGLFMIFPVFALYANNYTHATPALIGIALGVYGLTQAALQLPLSMISDRVGRRPVILTGLIVFACGSVIAAVADNIYFLILGRALQGAGAIGSTLIALAADLTRVENRTKTMAILGITIGITFAMAMILGPMVSTWFHLSGIFWLTAIFALTGIAILFFLVPDSKKFITHHSDQSIWSSLNIILRHPELTKLNIAILVLHTILSGSFVIIPLLFSDLHIATANQWQIYLPVLAGSFALTMLLVMIAEKQHHVKGIILVGISVIALGEWLLYRQPSNKISLFIALLTFFTGFTVLEAILPSLISKLAPSRYKGSSMGLYSTFQFLGIFLGGLFAGILHSHYNNAIIFRCALLLSAIWLLYMFTMAKPPLFKTEILPIDATVTPEQAKRLAADLAKVPGILDVDVSIEDRIAYLKVDNKIFNPQAFEQAKVMVAN